MNRIRNPGDVIGGSLLIATGLFFIIAGRHYSTGTLFQMGPGAFPFALAIVIIVFGAVIAVTGLLRSGRVELPSLRPLLFTSLSMVVFAVVFWFFGLIPAVAATTIVSSMADNDFNFKTAIVSGIGLGIGCWLVFIIGLQLPMTALRMPW